MYAFLKSLSVQLLTSVMLMSAVANAQRDDQRALSVQESHLATDWALLIGVNQYAKMRNLKYCGKDTEHLAACLRSSGYQSHQLTVLASSSASQNKQPSSANIRQHLNLLLGELNQDGSAVATAGKLRPEDSFVLLFSGHGVHINGVSYLCPGDADQNDMATLISVDHIYRQLELCPAKVKLVFLDACRNGLQEAGTRSPGNPQQEPTSEEAQFAMLLRNPPEGTLVFTSCAAGQVSYEDDGLEQGVFSHFLLEAINGAADSNRNGDITMFETLSFVSEQTKSFVTTKKQSLQTPCIRGNTPDFSLVQVKRRLPVPNPASFDYDLAKATQPGNVQVLQGFVNESNGLVVEGRTVGELAVVMSQRFRNVRVRIELDMWKGTATFNLGGTEVRLSNTASNIGRLSVAGGKQATFKMGRQTAVMIEGYLQNSQWKVSCPLTQETLLPVRGSETFDRLSITAEPGYGQDIRIRRIVVEPGTTEESPEK